MNNEIQKIIRSGFFVVLVLISGFFMSHVALALKVALEPEQVASVALSQNRPQDEMVLGENSLGKITIGFVGDIAPAHRENEFEIKNFFAHVETHLQAPDIMVGNLEGTFSMMGTPKCDESISGCYLFSGTQEFLDEITNSGFDVLSLANNHAYDYGKEGFDETKRVIAQNGLLAVGDKDSIGYKRFGDTMVAFVGATSYYWSPSLIEIDSLIAQIHEARENADIVIVVFHGGGEGRDFTHTPNETEWYMGENRGDLRMMARRSIDEGADLILGSGPHVLRGMEVYKQRLIAYSLGNFAFSGTKTISQKDILGISAILNVELLKNGEFDSGTLVPIQITSQGMPMLDPEKTALKMVQTLSQEDFTYTGVHIDENGGIFIPAN
ncbi:MAG: CapA family protein [Candidatus Pacebacteria bacterium]|nr:CapA family protein [Candidatus Paceibacterota bacterium]MBP9780908.1 CapA family protein [Candidatus Paceibacterota bacterium]